MQSSTVTLNAGQITQAKVRLFEKFSGFKASTLTGISSAAFRAHIESQLGRVDPEIEGYAADQTDRQRNLSIEFHWGHNHDFGDFEMKGRMRDRHIDVLAHFITLFSLSDSDFEKGTVLDVGCWTGGTTLLLSTLAAKIHAIEEVRKYAAMAQFLVDGFGLRERVTVEAKSLYACNEAAYFDQFHVAYFPGVIYHLSDPVLALRILFNAVKPGGFILVESMGIESDEPICHYAGGVLRSDSEKGKAGSRPPGWNWFVPSAVALDAMLGEAGFEDTQSYYVQGINRVFGFGRKKGQKDICRAGLSVPTIR